MMSSRTEKMEDIFLPCYVIEIIQHEEEYEIKVSGISEEGSPNLTDQFKDGENFKKFLDKLYSSDSMLDDFVTTENWRSEQDAEDNTVWHSDHILVDEKAGDTLDNYFGELCGICDKLNQSGSDSGDSDDSDSGNSVSDSKERIRGDRQEVAFSSRFFSSRRDQGKTEISARERNTNELMALLMSSPRKSEERALRLIEEADIDVNMFRDNSTIICFAISNGFHKVVDKLIEKGADLNLEKETWGNPIFFAIIHTTEKYTLYLLDRGVVLTPEKINRLIFWEDYTGFSLFHVACSKGYSKLTQRLIEAGADLHLPNDNGKTPAELARFGAKSQKGLTEQRKDILRQLGEEVIDSAESTTRRSKRLREEPAEAEKNPPVTTRLKR